MKFSLLTCVWVLNSLSLAKSWTLSSLNITTSSSVVHVSVYYGRAFLCLRHLAVDSHLPTLVEATWPENMIGVKPKVFPSEILHKRRLGKCKGIKQAEATDIDEHGRLWMIDSGTDSCSAKIVVYDLLYFNDEVSLIQCKIGSLIYSTSDPGALPSIWRIEREKVRPNCRRPSAV